MTTHTHTDIAMDTLITLRVDSDSVPTDVDAAMLRALRWFAAVEAACSRFDGTSELSALCQQTGVPVFVGPLLFEALAFAIEVAALTKGAFDPTVGVAQQRRGFDQPYVPGQSSVAIESAATAPSYLDVEIDRAAQTVTLRQPLLLDLGAVAKGLAIDLAVRELAQFERFAVDAGGDIYAGGVGAGGAPWRIGVRHPHQETAILETVTIWNEAVCTSGGYERPGGSEGHHIIDPRIGKTPRRFSSVTVIAPTAMVADALATAAFVLGPTKGLRLLAQQNVDGLLLTATDKLRKTPGIASRLG